MEALSRASIYSLHHEKIANFSSACTHERRHHLRDHPRAPKQNGATPAPTTKHTNYPGGSAQISEVYTSKVCHEHHLTP